VATAARAVHHAHQRGVLHRDLKPGNILLDAQGQPHVTDFGLARRVEGDAQHTRTGAIVGTPSYMPPEQARAEKGLTTGVDVYSLGAVLYELLTGRPPFRAATVLDTVLEVLEREPTPPRQLNRRIDRDLETICLKCLHKDPRGRYDSAAALADDLERFLAGEPIRARPVGRGERLVRWCRRNPALAAMASTAVLATVAGMAVSVAYAADRSAFAAEQESAAKQLEKLNADLNKEGKRTRAENKRAQTALRETNRVLATVALDRAQGLHDHADTAPALLQLVEAMRYAREAEDRGLERSARTRIRAWQGEVHRCRAVLAPPAPPSLPFRDDAGKVIGSVTGGYVQLDLSPGRRTALVRSGVTARLLDAATAEPLGPPLLGFGAIRTAALSADGTTVAISAGDPTTITTWNGVTGKQLGPPIVNRSREQGAAWYEGWLAISPDGKMLLVGDNQRKARRWDVASGKEIGTPFPWEKFTALAFSPDGRIIAAGDKSSFRLWESATGKSQQGQMEPFLAFSPDSRTLLTAAPGGGARLWDIESNLELGRLEPEGSEALRAGLSCAAFSPDGMRIVTGSGGGVIRIWDYGTRKPVGAPIVCGDGFRALAFAEDGRTIRAACAEKIRVWDLAGAAAAATAPWKTEWRPISVVYRPLVFHPDGQSLLMAGCQNKDVTRWRDLRTGTPRGPTLVPVAGGKVVSVDVSPDGTTALIGWWTHGGRPGKSFDVGGIKVMGGTGAGAIFVWDTANPTRPRRLADVPEEVMYAVFVKGGQAVALFSAADLNAPTMLRLFDAASGKALGEPLPVGPARTEPVAVSPDARYVVTGTSRAQPAQTAALWDVTARKRLDTPLLAKAGGVSHIAFSADGRLFATGGGTVVRLWRTEGGTPVGDPMVHKGDVTGLTFTPDGKTLVSSNRLPDGSGEVCLWDVPTGRPVLAPRRFPHGVDLIAVLPDSGSALAVSNRTVHVWPLPTPVGDDIDRLRLQLQVWTGAELRDVVGFQPLGAEQWLRRRRALAGQRSESR
jgi:WD40 repeat protein